MVSDFRKKKLLRVFNIFFDTDKSGSLDRDDFELVHKKLSELRGYKSGDGKSEKLHDELVKIWDSLQKNGDADNDGKITQDEWIDMWEKFLQNPTGELDWQDMYCKFVFMLEDSSGDGIIDAEEYSSVYVSFGLDKAESVEAFKKMAKGKDTVSLQEFEVLWKEYFSTEDQNAPGNYIFGLL